MSKETIEEIIETKVTALLTARALDQSSIAPQSEISEEVQRRLELLEQKIDSKDDGREQGLSFLLMAKQHAVRGEDASALRMYVLAKNFFPDNQKLDAKIGKLREKMEEKKQEGRKKEPGSVPQEQKTSKPTAVDLVKKFQHVREDDEDYQGEVADDQDYESDAGFRYKAKAKRVRPRATPPAAARFDRENMQTPRTKELLGIVNTRDINRIRLLKGVGAKKAEAIVEALCGEEDEEMKVVLTLGQLGQLRGIGTKTVDVMRYGLQTSS